ncbi:MAG: hypothetical protein Q9172_001065 [Xanthocarpia lactea]
MPATFTKRTVSPLRFESLRPSPEDILCPGSDTEESLERHEAKRRRVEQAGEQYLRGKPLYIASARLRGPFSCGWSNLHPTRKRRAEVSEVRDLPAKRPSFTENVKQEVAVGCQDVPIEISSHDTEASLPTSATHGPMEASSSPERKSFKEDLAAAKKKARAKQKWRLSFTHSGSVKGRSPQISSGRPRVSYDNQPGRNLPQSAEESSAEGKKNLDRSAPGNVETTSHPIEVLPEAQDVQEIRIPSGLSTGILETDKLSMKFAGTEDSYLGLSTQAAMLKAQNSFQNDLVSPTTSRVDPPSQTINRMDPRLQRIPDNQVLANVLTPGKGKEPMNTQAMIDAISPFADTTIKKRPALDRRISSSGSDLSPPLSPAAPNYENTSLSMSTSPSPTPGPVRDNPPIVPLSALSKPASSVISFSIAPNGTMTEVFQQDGQQPAQDYLIGDLDLDAAIEDAGSFLGEWNLEKEARKQERSTLGSKASTAKASRSR